MCRERAAWRQLSFAAGKHDKREQTVTLATELEDLAFIESIYHFASSLYHRTFKAYTDNKSLCQIQTSDWLNPRL